MVELGFRKEDRKNVGLSVVCSSKKRVFNVRLVSHAGCVLISKIEEGL